MADIQAIHFISYLVITCMLIACAISNVTGTGAVSALLGIYGLVLLGTIFVASTSAYNSSISTAGFGAVSSFIKWLPMIFIMVTLIMLIVIIGVYFDRVIDNKMPSSYYTFLTWSNIFLMVQICIVVSHFKSGNGVTMNVLSDKITMISILFGELGVIMASIMLSIILYNSTQC